MNLKYFKYLTDKKYISAQQAIIISAIVFLAIIVSIRYLDAVIAVNILCILRSNHYLHKATKNIPDLLSYIVVIGTILMWGLYFSSLHKKKINKKTHFLLLAATALPVSYILKTFFQYLFGKVNPRQWLIGHRPLVFDWLHKFGTGGFPSGHMTVFAAFGAAILFYFPQYRKPVLLLLFLLGIALIGTDYHFLSDVIAGTYLGFATTISLQFMFERLHAKK